jgi:selenide,water dikinase
VPGQSDNLMVGFETSDDAAVYLLDEDTAVLLTVDFFTPIVDDPYDFGRITAANALSDIYAMGGRPLTAMNLLAFPCALGPDVIAEVLRGGADVVREAGAVVVGGHTIEDKEPKFGLSVMGVARPGDVVRNVGARPGDALMLTKPLGTGIIGTALKRGVETEDRVRDVVESMAALNRAAGESMVEVGVSAGTDVTGFGLLGHLHEMLEGSGCAADVLVSAVPVFDRVLEHSANGVRPGRTADVITYASAFATWSADADESVWMGVLCDPQTSGGMLVSLPDERVAEFERAMTDRGGSATRIGSVREGPPGSIVMI